MKKAKDYATEYIATGKTVDSLTNIIHEMVYETQELMQNRRAKSNEAMFAIFNELDEKYRSFAARVGGVTPYGFAIGIRGIFPDVYVYWIARFPHRAFRKADPKATISAGTLLAEPSTGGGN